MSGYDKVTGWRHFTLMKWRRYARLVDGLPDSVDERCVLSGVEFHTDAAGGIHAHCDERRLWEILSGDPAAWGMSETHGTEPEWLSLTDLGANFDPRKASSAVLATLRHAGLLERVDGHDVPTAAAEGLFSEREAPLSGRFESRPGAFQRRWRFEVLAQLLAIGD